MTVARAIAAMHSGKWGDLTRSEWRDAADAIEPLVVAALSSETVVAVEESTGPSGPYIHPSGHSHHLVGRAPDSIREAILAPGAE